MRAVSATFRIADLSNRSIMLSNSTNLLGITSSPELLETHPDIAAKVSGSVSSLSILKERTIDYPREIWYLYACIIVFLSFFNACSLVLSRLWKRSAQLSTDREGFPSTSRRLSWRRLHVALINAWRVYVFRTVIVVGQRNICSWNAAEAFMTVAYVAVLFIWSLINCERTLITDI